MSTKLSMMLSPLVVVHSLHDMSQGIVYMCSSVSAVTIAKTLLLALFHKIVSPIHQVYRDP